MTSRISILLRLKEIGRYRHFYIVLGFFLGPVPLGSIKDLPAATCGEIKASEGDEMANGKYWIYSDGFGGVIEAYCDGKSFNLDRVHHETESCWCHHISLVFTS